MYPLELMHGFVKDICKNFKNNPHYNKKGLFSVVGQQMSNCCPSGAREAFPGGLGNRQENKFFPTFPKVGNELQFFRGVLQAARKSGGFGEKCQED